MTPRALALIALLAAAVSASAVPAQTPSGADQAPAEKGKSDPAQAEKQTAPTIRIARAKTDDGKTGHVCVSAEGGEATKVVLTMDGVPVSPRPAGANRALQGDECPTPWDYRLPLVPGTHYLEAGVYVNNSSTPAAVARDSLIGRRDTSVPRRLHIFTVGINTYQAGVGPLTFARKDAQAFSDSLRIQARPLFDTVIVTSLFDGRATKKAIDSTFRVIRDNVDTTDTFVFFFAGHGALVKNHLYLAGAQTRSLSDEDNLRDEGIMDDLLITLMRDIQVKSKLMVLDACHSGQVLAAFNGKEALGANAVNNLQVGIRNTGDIAILAATDSLGLAMEQGQLGHGLFTYALLQGREPQKRRDVWTISELKTRADNYLKDWYFNNSSGFVPSQMFVARTPAVDFDLVVR